MPLKPKTIVPRKFFIEHPIRFSRRASREQVYIVREFVWLQMLNRGMKTWGIAVSDAHIQSMETEWVDGELMCGAQRMIQPRSTGEKLAEEPREVR